MLKFKCDIFGDFQTLCLALVINDQIKDKALHDRLHSFNELFHLLFKFRLDFQVFRKVSKIVVLGKRSKFFLVNKSSELIFDRKTDKLSDDQVHGFRNVKTMLEISLYSIGSSKQICRFLAIRKDQL